MILLITPQLALSDQRRRSAGRSECAKHLSKRFLDMLDTSRRFISCTGGHTNHVFHVAIGKLRFTYTNALPRSKSTFDVGTYHLQKYWKSSVQLPKKDAFRLAFLWTSGWTWNRNSITYIPSCPVKEHPRPIFSTELLAKSDQTILFS